MRSGKRKRREKLNRELDRLKFLDEQWRARETESSMGRRAMTTAEPDSARAEGRTAPRKQIRCLRCQALGHYARDCKATLGDTTVTEQSTVTPPGPLTSQVRGTFGASSNFETYLRVSMLGKTVECLLDTGSEVSLLPSKVVGRIALTPTTQTLCAANGTTILVRGEVTVTACIDTHSFNITAYVCDQVADAILGADFLKEHQAVWSFGRELLVGGATFRLFSRKKASLIRRIIAAETVTVPPESECLIPGNVMFRSWPKTAEGSNWMTVANEFIEGLRVSRVFFSRQEPRCAGASPEYQLT